METKHTPGPWKVNEEKDAIWISPPNPKDNVICDVVGRIYDIEKATVDFTDEDVANAHLIAAAPEMLEELENVLKDLNAFIDAVVVDADMIVPMWVNDRKDEIEILIAKAKGES